MPHSNFFFGDIKPRVSYSKKVANDFARQKDYMDMLDTYEGTYRDYDFIDKMNVNYDLANGRLDLSLYDEAISFNIAGEKVTIDHNNITHYPFTSQIFQAMYGEILNRPFKPVAKDIGSFAQTLRNKKYNELIRDLLNSEILEPLRNQVTQQYMQQLGSSGVDVRALNPEEQMQVRADLQRRIQARTPEDILNFMQNDFQTVTQRQAQQLLDYLIENKQINHIQQEGFKHALITGREIYYVGEEHGEPVLKLVNPKYFVWSGSQNTYKVQEGDWCRYEEWMTYATVSQHLAEVLNRASFKELEGFIEPIGGFRDYGNPRKDRILEKTMYELSREDGYIAKKFGDINIRTKEGQNRMKEAYSAVINKYGHIHGYGFSDYGVRRAHFAWMDKRKLYRVERVVNGKIEKFWLDEHYERTDQDIKIVEVWVNEAWEGEKIGTVDCIYTNIRPVMNQYRSIFDPFSAKLPYYGREYNTHMNNSKNVAWMDLGKSFQKEIDTTMAMLKHDLATDVGNVFVMLMNLKPDNITWQDWIGTMRNSKLLLANVQRHGMSGVDPQFLRGVNLSRTSDIAAKIQLVEFYKNELLRSMYFNPARLGAVGKYETNENVQVSQSASYNQTEHYFETHRQIVEEALNSFMNIAKSLYKDQPHKLAHIMDDPARMDMMISEDFWYQEQAIEFRISSKELEKMERLRSNMLAFVQNQFTPDSILSMTMADTPSDLISVFKRESERLEKQRQEAVASQQEQTRQVLEAEALEKEKERQFKAQLEIEKQQYQLKRTEIDSEKFRKQNDVNQNQLSDMYESKLLEVQAKLQMNKEKLEADLEKQKLQLELKEKELEIKLMELKLKEEELTLQKTTEK